MTLIQILALIEGCIGFVESDTLKSLVAIATRQASGTDPTSEELELLNVQREFAVKRALDSLGA